MLPTRKNLCPVNTKRRVNQPIKSINLYKNADMFYACFIKESRSASEIYR
ncbi:hypothetical protein A680_04978 [Salmonella enterica subsp. enterica serovar Enteritidis str. 2010K-0286]|uniref:Uncharacterized protein n=1 Tax=Salmonella enteritidis (strain 2009K0958) TaxID=1192586 RepID=A0A656INL1_SALE2|nr:hypothetical protein A672_04928 [Salmonella enterica subsp. enterica serovar Enteritidis str. 08-1080]EPI76602.1 hypothetical protein A673_00293 [Salmonella enterica subsp. enterica serovar Enteritidis str. 2009K0958]EPJ07142.1 hypothetical protein A680_04978 [Salmonella enterica subsp. enterica serovar Enteritidis str. 2010K-0286]